MTLRKAHALSAVFIAAFIFVHIANHLVGLTGVAGHIAFMEAARVVYRHPLVEIALLNCIALQIATGLTLLAKGWKHRHGFIAWLQAISGAYLSFFLMVHVGSVLFGRYSLSLDTNFYFAAAGLHVPPYQFFFAPYYFLGITVVFVHISCAVYRRSQRLPRTAQIFVFAVPSIVGLTVSLLIVLSLSGVTFPVDIPARYKDTFAAHPQQLVLTKR